MNINILDFISRNILELLWLGTTSIVVYLWKKLKDFNRRNIATQNAVQALLKSSIIKIYTNYARQKYMPIHERENLLSLYQEYTALGGNGTVVDLVKKCMQLPVEPEEFNN